MKMCTYTYHTIILFNIKLLLNENKKINGKNNKKRIEKDIVIFHKISCRL